MRQLLDTHAPTSMRRWASELPEIVAEVVRHWDLVLESPFEPGGQCSWTAPAGDVVVKVGWRHSESEYEAAGLRRWDGNATVRVYDELATESTRALLLERCRPGTWLQADIAPVEQDAVIAALLLRLWTAEPAGFPALADMCDEWADHAEAQPSSTDKQLVSDGLALLRELPRTAPSNVLLSTDLHAMNVLAAERETWLVVDPKPHAGDPHYDLTQHLFNNHSRLDADPVGWIDRMAALCDLDRSRTRAWMFARLIQQSPRHPWYAEIARRIPL